jgi:hypothetical protein
MGKRFHIWQPPKRAASEPLTIVDSALPSGELGESYTYQLTATGGQEPYYWTSTGFPIWLDLDPYTGIISGTPEGFGTFTLSVKVDDPKGNIAEKQLSLTIEGEPLAIVDTALPSGELGEPYSYQLTATGGLEPYFWTYSSFPIGLDLDASTGIILGTPEEFGTFTLSVTVDDLLGNIAKKQLTLKIEGTALEITDSVLPSGTMGTAYSHTLTAIGGKGPYYWYEDAGALPDGLFFDGSTGVISGTPSGYDSGTLTFDMSVMDIYYNIASKTLTMTIAVPPLTITNVSLPAVTVGRDYSVKIGATGGVGFYYWEAGGLPGGVSIDTFTGELSGTPAQSGTFNVGLRVYDDRHTVYGEKSLTLVVNGQPMITTTSLNVAVQGQSFEQTLSGMSGTAPYTWSASSLPSGLSIGSDTGTISGIPMGNGTFAFNVFLTDASGAQVGQYLNITVNQALAITTTSLPSGKVNVSYTAPLNVTGGIPPYSVIGYGGIPSGLNFNTSSLTIFGTPKSSGSYNVYFNIRDSAGNTAYRSLNILILSA